MEELTLSSPESSDAAGGAEKSREQSEKQRESYKKAQAQIQKSQKDEKKAHGDEQDLFQILERFIQNPYYEDLVPLVTELLQKSAPARYIITTIALFYPEATVHLLSAIGRPQDINLLLSIHRYAEPKEFIERELDPSIRIWMSSWVQSGRIYLTQSEMSLIQQKKLVGLLESDVFFTDALAQGLTFFFTSRQLIVQSQLMQQYAHHIALEYREALTRVIEGGDKDLLENATIDKYSLFGLTDESQEGGISR